MGSGTVPQLSSRENQDGAAEVHMAFNFAKRAAEREEAENAKRLRERAATEKVWGRAAELESDFMSYARSNLYKQNMRSNLKGDRVTFREGAKIVEVVVVEPKTFRVRTGVGAELLPEFGSNDAVPVSGDNALMDLLDAWARVQ